MKSALPSPSWSRSSVRYPVLCSATMTSLLGRTSNRRGCSNPVTNGVAVKPSITRGVCPAYGMSRDRLAATGSVFGGGKFFRLDKKPSAQLLIGIAGRISSYGLRGGAALLSIGRGINYPNSRHSRGHYANIASHEVLPVLLLTRSLPTGACRAAFPGPIQYAR